MKQGGACDYKRQFHLTNLFAGGSSDLQTEA